MLLFFKERYFHCAVQELGSRTSCPCEQKSTAYLRTGAGAYRITPGAGNTYYVSWSEQSGKRWCFKVFLGG